MLPTVNHFLQFAWVATLLISSASAAVTSKGCYVNDGSLTSVGTYQFQSQGNCATECTSRGFAVFGMSSGNDCSCGNAVPSTAAAASSCDTTCVGYPADICGGTGFYSVWLTGVGTQSGSGAGNVAVSGTTAAATTTPTRTPTTTAAPSVVLVVTSIVQQGVTVIQTVSATATADRRSSPTASSSAASSAGATSGKSSGSSGVSAGAIAGIVIGVLAALAIGAAAIFFYRRRNRESDDFGGEYKRQIDPASAGVVRSHPSSLDNRLDTSLAIRRNSSESLADNQDYSRKILRVVN